MKGKKIIQPVAGALLAAAGVAAILITHGAATAENATRQALVPFALGWIAAVIGILVLVVGLLPPRKITNVRTLTMAAMFAALCYVGFAYFQIKIPVGDDSTSFHLGNVFCVLAALCIGGMWGGLAGAVGMTIGDLFDPVYITSAPKTFVLKLCIGLITGLVAHKIFGLGREKQRKVSLPVATVISCACGMGFNVVADPVVGYFYKTYVLGVPQDAAAIWVKIGAVTTAVNAVVAVVAATVLYLVLRPALKRSKLLPYVK
jgi:uncharacterized membrane protein